MLNCVYQVQPRESLLGAGARVTGGASAPRRNRGACARGWLQRRRWPSLKPPSHAAWLGFLRTSFPLLFRALSRRAGLSRVADGMECTGSTAVRQPVISGSSLPLVPILVRTAVAVAVAAGRVVPDSSSPRLLAASLPGDQLWQPQHPRHRVRGGGGRHHGRGGAVPGRHGAALRGAHRRADHPQRAARGGRGGRRGCRDGRRRTDRSKHRLHSSSLLCSTWLKQTAT